MDVEIKPRPPAEQFSDLLVQYRKQCRDLQGGSLSQARLAELLELEAGVMGYDGRRISRWERGLDIIRQDNRELLVGFVLVFHRCMGMADRATADTFLTTGQYSPLTESEAHRINPKWVVQAPLPTEPKTAEPSPPPIPPSTPPFPTPFPTRAQMGAFIYERLPDPHLRTPRGIVIWLMRQGEHVPWIGLVFTPLLAALSYILMMPALLWPIPNLTERLEAYVGFGLAHLFLPTAVAMLLVPDGYEKFALPTTKDKRELFFLKWVGSVVGFTAITMIVWLMGIFFHAVGWDGGWPQTGLGALTAVGPISLAYVAGGRIPIDRYKLFNGEVRRHPVDTYFGLTFFFIPWVLMTIAFVTHDFLADPMIGIVFIAGLASIVLWEQHKKKPSLLSDEQLLIILGVLVPLVLLWMIRTDYFPDYPPSADDFELGLIVWMYGQALVLFGLAVKLWRPSKWGWRQWGRTAVELLFLVAAMVGAIGLSIISVWGALGLFVLFVIAFILTIRRKGQADSPANTINTQHG